MNSHDIAEEVRDGLRSVMDPELDISVVDLGLVRDIHVSDELVQIMMTLTTPACPYGPQLIEATQNRATEVSGKDSVVQLVWEPPWDPMKEASEDALAILGVWI